MAALLVLPMVQVVAEPDHSLGMEVDRSPGVTPAAAALGAALVLPLTAVADLRSVTP